MERCYDCCKHRELGYCHKFKTRIYVTNVHREPRIPIHPYNFVSLYYEDSGGIDRLIDIASKYLSEDKIAMSICTTYLSQKNITEKQRKYLVYKILNCYEPGGE